MKNITTKLKLLSALIAVNFLLLAQKANAATITERMKDALGISDLASAEKVPLEVAAGGILNAFLSVFGVVFLGLMVYGGYKWMIAQGREEEITKAKNIIKSAIIGLGISLIAYAITYFTVYMFARASGVIK